MSKRRGSSRREHYDEQRGDLDSLLSVHADEIASEVEPPSTSGESSRVVEDIFRCLTDINAEGQAIRRPRKLEELIAVAGGEEAGNQHQLRHMSHGKRTRVAAVAGRRIDAEDAAQTRFPSAAVPLVAEEVRGLLASQVVGTVVASAACGADIVALEAARELGLHLVVVLPFESAKFRETSVTDRGGDWGKRFDVLVAGQDVEVIQLAQTGPEDAAYAEATRRIVAEAAKRAPLGDVPLAIVISDGESKSDGDATQDFIDRAEATGMKVCLVLSRR